MRPYRKKKIMYKIIIDLAFYFLRVPLNNCRKFMKWKLRFCVIKWQKRRWRYFYILGVTDWYSWYHGYHSGVIIMRIEHIIWLDYELWLQNFIILLNYYFKGCSSFLCTFMHLVKKKIWKTKLTDRPLIELEGRD